MPTHARTLLRPALLLALLVALCAALLSVAPTAAQAASATPTATTGSTAQKVLDEAAKHRGKPYKFGATGPSRFDCSGYVKYVFARATGKSLPRTSRQQYAAAAKVAKTAKKPGDLIFTRSSSGRIGHVGIYAGNGKFWVSPRSGSVVKLQKIYTSNYVVGRV